MAPLPFRQPLCPGPVTHPNYLQVLCTLSLHPPLLVREARYHTGMEEATWKRANLPPPIYVAVSTSDVTFTSVMVMYFCGNLGELQATPIAFTRFALREAYLPPSADVSSQRIRRLCLTSSLN